jgi:hypothetical protein
MASNPAAAYGQCFELEDFTACPVAYQMTVIIDAADGCGIPILAMAANSKLWTAAVLVAAPKQTF